MKTDLSKLWNNGYGTGYVQARADGGHITQEEADREIGYINEDNINSSDEVLHKESEECSMRGLLQLTINELYDQYMKKGGEISVVRVDDSTAIVWTRPSDNVEKTPVVVLR